MRAPTLPGTLVGRGVCGSVLLLLAGLVVNELPPSPVRFLVAPLQWLGTNAPGRFLALVVTLIGVALLTHAWVSLVRAPAEGSADQRIRHVWGVTLRWMAPLLIAPPLFSHDGWSYMAQGAVAASGRDPYTISPGEMPELLTSMVDPIWRYTPTPYGPIPIIWGALTREVFGDPTLLLLLQRVPALIGLGLTAWAVPRLARHLGIDPARATALAIASPFVLVHAVGGLHNDALVMGLVAAAFVFAAERRWVIGVVLVGLAAAVKFTAVVAVVPVVLVSLPGAVRVPGRFVRLAAGGLIAAATVAASGIPYGLGLGWVKVLSVPGVVVTPASAPTAVGVVLEWLLAQTGSGLEMYAVPVVRALGMALAVALVIVLALTRPTGDPTSGLATCIGVFAAVVLLAPVVPSWYALAVVPAAALLLLERRRTRRAIFLGAALAFLAPLDSEMAGGSLLAAGLVVLGLTIVRGVRAGDSRPVADA